MRKTPMMAVWLTVATLAGSYFAYAQQGSPEHPMNFFITSAGMGNGGNFGGLKGADAYCQLLGSRVGAGNKTWRAYLSTQERTGEPAIHARDRIGTGPWYNANGEMVAQDLAHLHGDTPELARLGNNITKLTNLPKRARSSTAWAIFPIPWTATSIMSPRRLTPTATKSSPAPSRTDELTQARPSTTRATITPATQVARAAR